MWKCPSYRVGLIRFKRPVRILRYHDHLQLEEPRSNSFRIGDRAIPILAPKIWKQFPFKIRNSPSLDVFEKDVKTILFDHNFGKHH